MAAVNPPLPEGASYMRILLIFKSTAFTEAGLKYDHDLAARRALYIQSLARAGILLAEESLLPSSSGLRITFKPEGLGFNEAVGPFSADGGLMEAFLILDVGSMGEARELALEFPVPRERGETTLELRQLAEEVVTHHNPALIAMETYLREPF